MEIDKPYHYRVHGLRLESTRLIPGLVSVEGGELPGVAISFEGMPGWFGGHLVKECQAMQVLQLPFLRVTVYRGTANPYWHFQYIDHTEYLIRGDGMEIWVSWPEPVAFALVCAYLLGPVFALLLQLRGRTPLHASSVVIDGLAVAFLGPSGAGKSTTAAKFAQLGCAVLSEDVLNLLREDGEFKATPGYPVIRLLPQSVQMLHGLAGSLAHPAPGGDKLCLDPQLGAGRFEGESKPLAAIYALKPRTDDNRAPYIEPLEPHAAALELLANTLGKLLIDAEGRARNFTFLTRLALDIPLRKMVPHSDPDQLARMCELILEDFRNQVTPLRKTRATAHV